MSEIKNLVRCSRGHFYDGDKFSECPHCKNLAPAGTTVGADTSPRKAGEKTVGIDTDRSTVTVSGEYAHTEPISWSASNRPTEEPPAEKPPVKIHSQGEKTIGYYFAEIKSEPVVGWLVCVDGNSVGKSFNLKSGKNFIGRSEAENDIVIRDDKSVSRVKHAILVYDPKSRRFLAQPGMSSELFYLNDDVVLQAVPLKERDVLQIGETKLMFIPLCGPEFTWDEYIKKEKKEDEK